jgi:two-component system, NarL family, sensor kinase
MKFRILLFLAFISAITNAQSTKGITNEITKTYALQNDSNKVISLLHLSTQYQEINHDTAIVLAQKALKIATAISYPRGKTEALFRIGDNYFFINYKEKSKDYLIKSIDNEQKITSKYWTARSYRKLALIFFSEGNTKKAQELESKAIQIHIARKDSSNIAQCYNQFANFFKKTGQIDSAFTYIKQAIEIEKKLDDQRALARSFRNLASTYLANKNQEKAEYFYKKTLAIQNTIGSKHERIHTFRKLGELYTQKGQYKLAINYIKQGIQISEKIHLLRGLPELYHSLSNAQELNKEHKNAFKNYTKFIQLHDSIQFKDEKIAEARKENKSKVIELHQENLQLERTIEDQFINNKKRKILTFILIIVLIILIGLIINAIKKKDLIQQITNKEKELTKQLISKDIKEVQFKAIQKITNNQEITKERIAKELHDELGGTLTAVKINLMQISEDAEMNRIIESIGEIAKTSRFISHDLHPPLLESSDFCSLITDYLNHFFNNYEIEITTTLLPENKINALASNIQLILYRIIQELCSNIKSHSKASKIDFQLIAHTNDINLVIEDNGIGFETKNISLKPHKGIPLIKEQLKVIGGEIEIESTKKQGSAIYIFIPTNTTSV